MSSALEESIYLKKHSGKSFHKVPCLSESDFSCSLLTDRSTTKNNYDRDEEIIYASGGGGGVQGLAGMGAGASSGS